MENELKQLIKLEGEKMTITSVDLCKLINILRREEKGKEAKELAHFNLMISIKSEIETLKSLGISPLNFQESTYVNPRGKVYPCFILNDESMLQMLNKESTFVRYKTTKLIKELKEENAKLKQQLQNQKPQLSPQEQLALQLFNGGIDAITAHKQLLELETKELNKTIETQGETIKEQKPFVDIALERIAKGECLSLTDINTGMNIVRGRLTKWAKEKGYLHKTQTEVNESGRKYFKVYINGKYKSIGVTKEGIKLINNNLEEIRNFGAKKNKGDKKIKF